MNMIESGQTELLVAKVGGGVFGLKNQFLDIEGDEGAGSFVAPQQATLPRSGFVQLIIPPDLAT
ncbi:hypothetical protein RIE95_15145 [Acidithiobacillus thiooxidans]|uniref:hypothetical protein n=1 Tax=Acidithiobacillus thiooxidans TaxID=930 RepID=UPI00285B754D|nr:hypothetical protein [Acidithiobacillus thiooxidans]MDR7928301.1 hypothetical protein [Acidithiobacillus thiooxidans]